MEKEEEEKKEKGRIWNKKCSHVRVSSTDTSMKDSQGPGLGKKEESIVENKKKKFS
jgi:hypothetical protein